MSKKPKHAFKLEELSTQDKKLYTDCIRKFFLTKLPELNAISRIPKIKKHFGTDIQSLGIEHGLESCFKLFEEGALELIAHDVHNFVVLLHTPHEAELIFRIENGKHTI